MKRSFLFPTKKKLAIEFVTVFAVTLVVTAVVTFLWNFIGHGEITADWGNKVDIVDYVLRHPGSACSAG